MVNKLRFNVNAFSTAAYKWGYTVSTLKCLIYILIKGLNLSYYTQFIAPPVNLAPVLDSQLENY